ncbi:MAG: enoyl-CoA hydratase/isomerase family protein [Burkholderiaceae bacterium]|nr:enoyl-CoA hydratase/isomerase family protein [Burkholderiaceae bacterium]
MTEPRTPVHTTLDADGIATLTIRGAKGINIVGSAEIVAVSAELARLRDEPGLRALVLRGHGDRAFVGGADIAEMATLTPATAATFITGLKDLCEAVRLFPAPVIARIAGWCLGGGLEVAMACDLRLGSSDSKYGMPEVKVGIPSVIHAALMPRLAGPSAAAWLLLTGDTIDAATALGHGLVHRVCPLAELDDAVQQTARQLAALGPQVLRQQKALLRDWARLPVEEAIERSVAEFAQAFTTGEPQRYMRQFLDRQRGGGPRPA